MTMMVIAADNYPRRWCMDPAWKLSLVWPV